MKVELKQSVSRISYFFVLLLISSGLYAQPTLSSFSPASGPVGTAVTITGSSFSDVASDNTVYFGGVKATVLSASSTSLEVTVPSGAANQPISVTTNNLTAYSNKLFNITFSGASVISTTSFADKIDHFVPAAAYGNALADVDGDGKLDMLAVNEFYQLSVFRNLSSEGILSFAAREDYPTAGWPVSIATGDLDGDGKLDVVVTNFHLDLISIFRNTSTIGNLSFAARVDYATGDSPYGVVIADFNGDGKPDIVASDNDYPVGYVSVFTSQCTVGTISFQPKVDYSTPEWTRGLAVGDLNADGKLDLVSANQVGNISIFKNISTVGGPISFASRIDYSMPIGSSAESVSIGDLDGDGMLDLAVANNNSGNISLLRNTGSGGIISFGPSVDYNLGGLPFSIAIANLNGDTKPDIAVTNQMDNNKVSVLRNTSSINSLSFDPQIDFVTGTNPRSISVGDLSGDGAPELVVSNQSGDKTISVLKNQMLISLAVDFINLEAKTEDSGIKLAWVVQGEADGEYYDVEKSPDGILFQRIGSVPGSGKAKYTFTDVHLQTKNFYRIKAVDMNGTKRYSNVVGTHSTLASARLNIFPNPTQSLATIEHPTAQTNSALILYSVDGRLIKTIRPVQGLRQTTIDISFLKAGAYLIFYKDSERYQFIKLVKQ